MAWLSPTDLRLPVVIFLAVFGPASDRLAAQSVEGRILDAGTDEPVKSAIIQLLGGENADERLASVLSSDEGHFLLEAPASGTYRLHVERIGYEAVTTAPFDLLPGRLLEVELRTSAEALPLPALTIISDRPARLRNIRLHARGYYDRKDRWGKEGLGFGHFLEREDIERTNAFRFTDVVRMLRGVRVEGAGGQRMRITFRSVTSLFGLRCVPTVFVNGAPVASGWDIDEVVSPLDIAAVEVYPGLTMPAQFITGRACGAIAVWTGR